MYTHVCSHRFSLTNPPNEQRREQRTVKCSVIESNASLLCGAQTGVAFRSEIQ